MATGFEDNSGSILKLEINTSAGFLEVENSQQKMEVSIQEISGYQPGYKAVVTFGNISKDTLWLTNVAPFGFSKDMVSITDGFAACIAGI